MKTLLKFLLTYGIYFIFVLLELAALLLIVNNNHFQNSVFFTSCNSVTASIYNANNSVVDYFSLRQVNEELAVENAELKNQLNKTENLLKSIPTDSLQVASFVLSPECQYTCYSAKVINNSTNKLLNYITLNKGLKHGIKEEMSVISPQGVVGIVKAVSENFSVVMPLLNSYAQISCKIKNKNIKSRNSVGAVKDIGSLKWDGRDSRFANMLQVPRHVKISKGDSIVTSGYSDFFPEGVFVGTIEKFENANDDNYYYILVRLGVNFKTVSFVQVMDYKNRIEQETLEETAKK